jgi:hypothetical protein
LSISTIKEGRREIQEDFYHLLKRLQKEGLGSKEMMTQYLKNSEVAQVVTTKAWALAEMKKSFHVRGSLAVHDAHVCSISLA